MYMIIVHTYCYYYLDSQNQIGFRIFRKINKPKIFCVLFFISCIQDFIFQNRNINNIRKLPIVPLNNDKCNLFRLQYLPNRTFILTFCTKTSKLIWAYLECGNNIDGGNSLPTIK